MFTLDIVVAAVLLTAPADAPIPSAAHLEGIRPTLVAVAINAEWIDPREVSSLLSYTCDDDIKRLRWRTTQNLPVLADLLRFPSREALDSAACINRCYRQAIVDRMAFDPLHADAILAAIEETDRLYQIYDTLRDANTVYYYTPVRRESLDLVRTLIGDTAYYSGVLPAHVPMRCLPRK